MKYVHNSNAPTDIDVVAVKKYNKTQNYVMISCAWHENAALHTCLKYCATRNLNCIFNFSSKYFFDLFTLYTLLLYKKLCYEFLFSFRWAFSPRVGFHSSYCLHIYSMHYKTSWPAACCMAISVPTPHLYLHFLPKDWTYQIHLHYWLFKPHGIDREEITKYLQLFCLIRQLCIFSSCNSGIKFKISCQWDKGRRD